MVSKKARKLSSVFLVVLVVFLAFVMFYGDITYTFQDDYLFVDTNMYTDYMLRYDVIDSMEFREGNVPGLRVGGFGSLRLLMGFFENEEFGTYTRYTYYKPDAMKENTDLVQIRPAFGGNIMAQIVTPRTRPQFCTVRYKVFSAPARQNGADGEIVTMPIKAEWNDVRVNVQQVIERPAESDISEADAIVAVGRGLKSPDDLALAQQLADALGAQLACTRPLVENGWMDASHQIGLSGKTVKPKLIITLGISGAVQFAAGMKGSDCIIAVNTDKTAPIFDVAHYCIVGDLYEVMNSMLNELKGGNANV